METFPLSDPALPPSNSIQPLLLCEFHSTGTHISYAALHEPHNPRKRAGIFFIAVAVQLIGR